MVIPGTKPLVAPLLALALAALAGCAKTGPASAPTPSVLNVPPAPPRVISVPPEPVAPVETATAEPPSEPRPSRPSRPSSRADNGARSSQTATEPEPTPATDVPSERPAEPAPTGPVLRTPQTADESEAVRRVRTVLKRATTLLGQVSAASLTREARTQHDTARRFVEQAEQALIERNLVFASYLADKAETLARGLSR
jgi:hypothetical protein